MEIQIKCLYGNLTVSCVVQLKDPVGSSQKHQQILVEVTDSSSSSFTSLIGSDNNNLRRWTSKEFHCSDELPQVFGQVMDKQLTAAAVTLANIGEDKVHLGKGVYIDEGLP